MVEKNIHKQIFRKAIRDLTLMDDVFMRTVMKDIRCAEYVLRIILDNSDLVLDGGYPEADMHNLWGRSLIMDFIGWNFREHTHYNIEVQNLEARASPDFCLYCYSMLSSYTLKKGYEFERTKEKYVIVMIVEGDPLKSGLPVSHNSLHIEETGVNIDAGLAIIYVDATRCDEDTEVGRLMKDFHQKNAKDMEKSVLQEAVQQYKETEEGVKYMTETLKRYFDQYVAPYEQAALAQGREEGIVQGRDQGQEQRTMEIVHRMIKRGDSDAEIQEIIDISPEEITEIRKEMNK